MPSDSDSPPALNSFNKRDRTPTFGQDYTSDRLEIESPVQNLSKPSFIQPLSKKQRPLQYVFKEEYLKKWTWLAYDTERQVAYCSLSGCSMYTPFKNFIDNL